MSDFLDKIKKDPDYTKAFDKGVAAGMVFLLVFEVIIVVIWKLSKHLH